MLSLDFASEIAIIEIIATARIMACNCDQILVLRDSVLGIGQTSDMKSSYDLGL